MGRSRRAQDGGRRLGRRQLDRRAAAGPRFRAARDRRRAWLCGVGFRRRIAHHRADGKRRSAGAEIQSSRRQRLLPRLSGPGGSRRNRRLQPAEAKAIAMGRREERKSSRPLAPATIRADSRSPPTGNCWPWPARQLLRYPPAEPARKSRKLSAAGNRCRRRPRRSATACARRSQATSTSAIAATAIKSKCSPPPANRCARSARAGEPKAGPYDPNHMNNPNGLAHRLAAGIYGSRKPISSRSGSAFGRSTASCQRLLRPERVWRRRQARSARQDAVLLSRHGVQARLASRHLAIGRRVLSPRTEGFAIRRSLSRRPAGIADLFRGPKILLQLLQQQSDQRRGRRYDLAAARRRGRARRRVRPGQRLEPAQVRRLQIALAGRNRSEGRSVARTRRCSPGRT